MRKTTSLALVILLAGFPGCERDLNVEENPTRSETGGRSNSTATSTGGGLVANADQGGAATGGAATGGAATGGAAAGGAATGGAATGGAATGGAAGGAATGGAATGGAATGGAATGGAATGGAATGGAATGGAAMGGAATGGAATGGAQNAGGNSGVAGTTNGTSVPCAERTEESCNGECAPIRGCIDKCNDAGAGLVYLGCGPMSCPALMTCASPAGDPSTCARFGSLCIPPGWTVTTTCPWTNCPRD
jgi:hypothetical protein